MYSLVFYVPETHVELVKNALFAKGAGHYAQYDCCAWQVLGTGQFRPLAGSQPFLGQVGQIEKVSEYRVEMICEEAIILDVIKTLIKTHPYQEPAYSVWQIKTIDDLLKNR